MSLVVLDTDVASGLLRRKLPDPLKTRLVGKTPCITFVTVGELTKWVWLRNWGPQRTRELTDWMRSVTILTFDPAVAVTWGGLQARAQLRGSPRPVNDTWIAACCLVYGLPLSTLNHKDFADFGTHEGLQFIENR